MGKLVLFLPDGSTQQIALDKERVVIGRRADNDVCLPYPAVSGEHAVVVTILADSFLEDMGSTNGTLVNGNTIQKHFLRDRDQIDIGRQKMIYLEGEAFDAADSKMHSVRNELRTFGEQVERAPMRRVRDLEEGMPAVVRGRGPNAASTAASARDVALPSIAEAHPAAVDSPMAKPVSAPSFELPPVDRLPDIPPRSVAPRPAPMRADSVAPPTRPRVTLPLDLGLPTPEAVAEPDDAIRNSTDRGLARMARIRHEGQEGNGKVDTVSQALPPVAAPAGKSVLDVSVDASPAPVATSNGQATPARSAEARVTVLSGPSAGRSLILDRDEIVIGRVGVQVAVIDRMGPGYRLKLREGENVPLVNGQSVGQAGRVLKSGDIFEVAGARIEFISAR